MTPIISKLTALPRSKMQAILIYSYTRMKP